MSCSLSYSVVKNTEGTNVGGLFWLLSCSTVRHTMRSDSVDFGLRVLDAWKLHKGGDLMFVLLLQGSDAGIESIRQGEWCGTN